MQNTILLPLSMKAEELRIGNKIYPGYLTTVREIHQHYIICDTMGGMHTMRLDMNLCNPLHINEQILLLFGFVKGNTNGSYGSYHGYSNGILELDNDFGLSLYDGRMDESTTKGFYAELKYAHQLQNLYFALTGNELEMEYDYTKGLNS